MSLVYSSFVTAPLLARAREATMMRRRLTTCRAALVLGLATLPGCLDPADIEEQGLDEMELEDLDQDELDDLAALAEDDLDDADLDDAQLDDAELTAETPAVAACALWSGYIAGVPSANFPATTHPVVGYKLNSTILQYDGWGNYFDYSVQHCNISSSYSKTYYRYITGIFAPNYHEPPQYWPQ